MPAHPTWSEWLGEYGPRLMLFARQQTRCEADAEDVLQSALIKTWKSHGDRPTDDLLGLVFTNIRRCAIDAARMQDRRTDREQRAVEEMGPPVAWFEMPDDDETRALQVALASLPEKFRDVITLKLWGDLTFAQIAETLDIPANTAASRYRYGLEQLRSHLAREREYLGK
ncbi:MAG: sigma-70 family RNA polymerase sigma factor [Verrucomicrobiales bacterium]|nr:sigma-70 family RNA polymerase sigma factor [Verrucomicrobiales bacterium]